MQHISRCRSQRRVGMDGRKQSCRDPGSKPVMSLSQMPPMNQGHRLPLLNLEPHETSLSRSTADFRQPLNNPSSFHWKSGSNVYQPSGGGRRPLRHPGMLCMAYLTLWKPLECGWQQQLGSSQEWLCDGPPLH